MKRLKEDIRNQSFHRAYLLYGEEEYLVRLYRDQLKKAVLGGEDEMNFTSYQGDGIDLSEVRDMAQTLPFFGEYRLILMEDSRLFKKANELSDMISEFPDTTIFLFVEKEVDKRNKLYKYVQKNGLSVEMNAMSPGETKQFVAMELQKAGKRIRESTADYLLEQVDNSLANIQNELEKLIAYTYGREEVARADIDAICSVQVTGQIFKMLDAVASGNKQETMKLYHDLLELKESPASILYLLGRHFRILLQVKSASGNLTRQELAKKLGIPPFSVGKYQAQCRHFSREQLKNMFTACADTDYAFKQGKIQDRIGVELLLVDFISARVAKAQQGYCRKG